MVKDGGKVLLSEPGVTTVLMVTQSFLSAHPAIVADLLKANMQAVSFIKSNPAAAETAANAELASYTGKPLKASIVAAAFKEITFTVDPDVVVADRRRAAGRQRRPPQAGQPQRHLRPHPAQQPALRGRPADGERLGG